MLMLIEMLNKNAIAQTRKMIPFVCPIEMFKTGN